MITLLCVRYPFKKGHYMYYNTELKSYWGCCTGYILKSSSLVDVYGVEGCDVVVVEPQSLL